MVCVRFDGARTRRRAFGRSVCAAFLLAPAIVTCGAGADVIGYYEVASFDGGFPPQEGLYALDLYLDFSLVTPVDGFERSDIRLRSVSDATLFNANGAAMLHSDAAGSAGSWSPALSLDVPGFAMPEIDSFVTIGGAPGATNTTMLDGAFDGAPTGVVPDGAGWFVADPDDDQGRVNDDFRVLIGRFVVQAEVGGKEILLGEFDFLYDYGVGSEAVAGELSFLDQGPVYYFPAPGALALFAIGFGGSRRRRG